MKWLLIVIVSLVWVHAEEIALDIEYFSEKKGMSVALANINNKTSVEANKQQILENVARAKQYGANVILFPEFSLSGYFWRGDNSESTKEVWDYMNSTTYYVQLGFIKLLQKQLDDGLQYILLNVLVPKDNNRPGSPTNPFYNMTIVLHKGFNADDLFSNQSSIYIKQYLPGIEKDFTVTDKRYSDSVIQTP